MEFVIFWIICGGIAAAIASSKGGNVGLGFALGLLLGPIGVVVAIVMGGKAPDALASQSQAQFKKCPMCAESVLAEAVICKHCRHDFYEEFKDTETWRA